MYLFPLYSWKLARRICRKRIWFARKVSIPHPSPPLKSTTQRSCRMQLLRDFPHLNRAKLFHYFQLHPGRQKLWSIQPSWWILRRISGSFPIGSAGREITPASSFWPSGRKRARRKKCIISCETGSRRRRERVGTFELSWWDKKHPEELHQSHLCLHPLRINVYE